MELQAATESVKRFMNAFEEDTSEFRAEYTRQVAQVGLGDSSNASRLAGWLADWLAGCL